MVVREPQGKQATLAEFETSFSMDEGIWREAYWGDMRVGYETYLKEYDDAPLLMGLPNDRCQCPHWGYLLSGRMTVRYANYEEVVEAGSVYYMSPDHSIKVDPGTVLIEFSPLDEWEKLMEVAEKNIAELAKEGTDTE
ncbi:cupin domain-containing protein [Halobellus captivus]|uniref:cupin domain-containing protein n=1 Tax=Halobellus captivus TaxID=2592614 RepID=UPI0011AAE4E5|nr:cupin domain-containing protein [Halobellus captivus]